MSTENLITPLLYEGPLDPKEALQQAADAYFLDRARYIVSGKLGQAVLRPRNLSDRTPDDVTMLGQYLLPADTERTEEVVHRFNGLFSNVPEAARAIDEAVDEQGLQDSENLVIVTGHHRMVDILGIAYTIFSTESFGDRSAEDNHMYISRLLGYAAYRSFGDISKIRPQLRELLTSDSGLKDKVKNIGKTTIDAIVNERTVTETYVLAGCNALQVFPYARSMQPLHDAHGPAIFAANRRTTLASARQQKDRQSNKTQIMLVGGPGSQAKEYHDGIMLEPMFPQTFDMLYRSYQNGAPILAAGFDIDLVQASLRIPEVQATSRGIQVGRRPIRISIGKALTLKDGLSREEFERALNRATLETARAVSKKKVYPFPTSLL